MGVDAEIGRNLPGLPDAFRAPTLPERRELLPGDEVAVPTRLDAARDELFPL
jgi:hypothetical protein